MKPIREAGTGWKLAADLVRTDKVKQADMAYMLLDWGDRYPREPADPPERLRR